MDSKYNQNNQNMLKALILASAPHTHTHKTLEWNGGCP